MKKIYSLIIILTTFQFCISPEKTEKFTDSWLKQSEGHWIGTDFWANRLQDWKLKNGKLICLNSEIPLRTVHIVSREINTDSFASFTIRAKIGILKEKKASEKVWAGFLIGAGDISTDYRTRALIQTNSGKGGGIITAVNAKGKLIFLNNEDKRKEILLSSVEEYKQPKITTEGIYLELKLSGEEQGNKMELTTFDSNNKPMSRAIIKNIPEKIIAGNIALAVNGNKEDINFWFENLELYGTRISKHEDRKINPICGVLFLNTNSEMSMTAQMMPISKYDQQYLSLEIAPKNTDNWQDISEQLIDTNTFTAKFRIKKWNNKNEYNFRLTYNNLLNSGKIEHIKLQGKIPAAAKGEIKIISTGNIKNSISAKQNENYNFEQNSLFPHKEATAKIKQEKADLLFFYGGQIDYNFPTVADLSSEKNTFLDYIYKLKIWYWDFGELTKKIPTVMLCSAHDYFQEKLWGESMNRPDSTEKPYRYKGKSGFWTNDKGGYVHGKKFAKKVEQTQTTHLKTDTNSERGFEFSEFNIGDFSFAVLDGLKNKSTPNNVLGELYPINSYPFDKEEVNTKKLNAKRAKILSDYQIEKIKKWQQKWKNTNYKILLTQQDFACISTYPDSLSHNYTEPLITKATKYDNHKAINMQSNGWSANRRDEIINILQKTNTLILCGDRQNAHFLKHSTENWNKGIFSFASPPLLNKKPSRWFPPPLPKHYKTEDKRNNLDAFGNKITVYSCTNEEENLNTTNASTFGKININNREKTIEADIITLNKNTKKEEYNFPIKVPFIKKHETDKYYLPKIILNKQKNVTVKIFTDSGKLVLISKLNTNKINLRVPNKGKYSIILECDKPFQIKKLPLKTASVAKSLLTPIEINFD